MQVNDVLKFWFEELSPKHWWTKSDKVDASIAQRFSVLHQRAAASELFAWRESARGRLAEIIVLDQFSRHLYRGKAQAFACDSMALALAQDLVARALDQALTVDQRAFAYMPYMHSESLLVHQQALSLFERLGREGSLASEKRHYKVIEQFGRYPHRNEYLARQSTAQEIEFLEQPGSSF